MHLVGAMHTDARTQVARQFLGSTSLPVSVEEPMLKACQQVGLEVIAPIATDPSPSWQGVEDRVGTLERGIHDFSSSGFGRSWVR